MPNLALQNMNFYLQKHSNESWKQQKSQHDSFLIPLGVLLIIWLLNKSLNFFARSGPDFGFTWLGYSVTWLSRLGPCHFKNRKSKDAEQKKERFVIFFWVLFICIEKMFLETKIEFSQENQMHTKKMRSDRSKIFEGKKRIQNGKQN